MARFSCSSTKDGESGHHGPILGLAGGAAENEPHKSSTISDGAIVAARWRSPESRYGLEFCCHVAATNDENNEDGAG